MSYWNWSQLYMSMYVQQVRWDGKHSKSRVVGFWENSWINFGWRYSLNPKILPKIYGGDTVKWSYSHAIQRLETDPEKLRNYENTKVTVYMYLFCSLTLFFSIELYVLMHSSYTLAHTRAHCGKADALTWNTEAKSRPVQASTWKIHRHEAEQSIYNIQGTMHK